MDNASSHRNDTIRTLINKHNKVLYAVPYQHFTNAIENFFSVFKSRLQKKVGITYSELKENIKETLKVIPSEIFKRIFQGSYERDEKYTPAIHYFLILLFVNILNWFKSENSRLRLRRAEQSSVV